MASLCASTSTVKGVSLSQKVAGERNVAFADKETRCVSIATHAGSPSPLLRSDELHKWVQTGLEACLGSLLSMEPVVLLNSFEM